MLQSGFLPKHSIDSIKTKEIAKTHHGNRQQRREHDQPSNKVNSNIPDPQPASPMPVSLGQAHTPSLRVSSPYHIPLGPLGASRGQYRHISPSTIQGKSNETSASSPFLRSSPSSPLRIGRVRNSDKSFPLHEDSESDVILSPRNPRRRVTPPRYPALASPDNLRAKNTQHSHPSPFSFMNSSIPLYPGAPSILSRRQAIPHQPTTAPKGWPPIRGNLVEDVEVGSINICGNGKRWEEASHIRPDDESSSNRHCDKPMLQYGDGRMHNIDSQSHYQEHDEKLIVEHQAQKRYSSFTARADRGNQSHSANLAISSTTTPQYTQPNSRTRNKNLDRRLGSLDDDPESPLRYNQPDPMVSQSRATDHAPAALCNQTITLGSTTAAKTPTAKNNTLSHSKHSMALRKSSPDVYTPSTSHLQRFDLQSGFSGNSPHRIYQVHSFLHSSTRRPFIRLRRILSISFQKQYLRTSTNKGKPVPFDRWNRSELCRHRNILQEWTEHMKALGLISGLAQSHRYRVQLLQV